MSFCATERRQASSEEQQQRRFQPSDVIDHEADIIMASRVIPVAAEIARFVGVVGRRQFQQQRRRWRNTAGLGRREAGDRGG